MLPGVAQGAAVGRKPTNSQKLIYISDKLGLKGIQDQQGSTLNLFDTVAIATNTTQRQTLSFFSSTTNKSNNFTNFQQGMLNAGESLVMERIAFYLATLSATDLTADATNITAITPLPMVLSAQVTRPDALVAGLMSINIANVSVVTGYQTSELKPEFNPQTVGYSVFDNSAYTGLTSHEFRGSGYSAIQMEAPPVLPPNQKFNLQLSLPPIGTVTGNLAIVCVIGRFGTRFSPKTTL